MRNELENCIEKFIIDDFQKYPGDFLKEQDIRSVLFTRIKDSLKNYRRKLPFEKLPKYPNELNFEMDLVKSEYSYENYEGQSRKAFDIAILNNEEDVWIGKDVWEKYHQNKTRVAQMYWNQPVRFGIEIKAGWHTWDTKKKISGILSDRQKLQNYPKSDYCSKNFKDKNQNPYQFEGAAFLFSSHELYDNRFKESSIQIDGNCNAFCITPTRVYKIL